MYSVITSFTEMYTFQRDQLQRGPWVNKTKKSRNMFRQLVTTDNTESSRKGGHSLLESVNTISKIVINFNHVHSEF